ncbi:MAG: hypothetical protein ACK55Z_07715 [bacterium]
MNTKMLGRTQLLPLHPRKTLNPNKRNNQARLRQLSKKWNIPLKSKMELLHRRVKHQKRIKSLKHLRYNSQPVCLLMKVQLPKSLECVCDLQICQDEA